MDEALLKVVECIIEGRNEFFNSGTLPPWAYVSTSKLSLAMLTEEEISWYAVLISIESLNKCKTFELYPRLAFYF